MIRSVRLLVVSLLTAIAVPALTSAQIRPDSARKDTSRVAVPVPLSSGVDTLAKRTSASDSAVFVREVARTDSIRRAIAADTIKDPLARFERPYDFETSPRLRFSREEILSSGAVNLADLLDRIPGVTTYRSGWIAGVHAASFAGDTRRIRLFVDGVEMDAIEPRNGGALDLTDVQLWTLEELVVERAAGEVRV